MKKVMSFLFTTVLILNCFSQSLPPYLPSNGLVAWYPFNGNANDESGNGNNGTVYGGVSLTSDKDGIINKAYDWPTSGASSNYIDIPDITHFFTNSFTLTAWIYMDGGSMDPRVISKGEMGVIANGTSNTSRTLRCYWDPGGLGFSPTNPVPAKQWVHIAFTADGNGGYARFYVNGEILNEGCCGQTTGSWPSGLWNIGRKSIGAYDSWGGKLDDIAIYNRALSQQEITQIYTTNTPSNCVANILNNDTTICSGSTINLTVNGSSSSGTNSSCVSPKVIGLSNTNFGLNATCKDNNDNIFVAGAYTGNTNFGNVTLAGIGGRDVFLVKYNSCGVQQWALRGGSTGNEDYAGVGSKSIATDSLGNVFIVGRYNQAFTFYGNNSTSFVAPYTATSNGNHQDGYLIKINSNGEVLWGATLRGGSNDGFNGVAVDNAGNPIVTGGFNGCCPSTFAVTIYGPNGSLGVSSFGSNYGSGLLVKFDANGNIIWKAAVYNRDTDLDKLAIDGANNIYLASEFRSWSSGTSGQFIDANGTNNSLYNPGIGLGFLVKLNSSGIWQWGVTYGNAGDGVSSLTSGTDVTIDSNGNPWISGFYRGALATFYTTSGSTLSLPASTNDIGFIAKYSAAGVPELVNSLQQSTGATYFNSIAIANDTIAIAGFFTGSNLGSNDVLLAKYNTSAVLQSIKTGGGTGDDQANSVVANGSGFIVSGTIGGASTIDDVALNSAGTFLWNNNTNGVNSSTYLWSTGATTPSISVSPSVTTKYFCTVSNGNNSCTDSVTITVSNLNSSLFSQDTIRACGTSYSLDAGSGYSSYSWSNGTTSQSINVTSTGWYKCTVSNGTCNAVDSIFLSIVQADILNVDTSICLGSSVTLNALSTCNGIQTQNLNWELLIPANSYVGGETNFDQAGFDQSNQILYSVLKNGSANRVYAFNLIDKTVSSLTSNNAPSELYEYAFDKTNNRIVSSRVGRDVVYALPLNGGTWQQIGSGSFDAESYGCTSFWNPISSRFGYFGGYGYYSTKNWIWENNGTGWLNTYANNNNCNLARRVGNQLARNNNGSKYYVFSGQGSCDGNQFASSCSLGSPWPTDVGVYCWLRDLWELDLTTYQFTNILPPNNQSIFKEGSFSFDYSKNTFYIIGGSAPTSTYGVYTPFSMEVLKYNRNTDAGFSAVTTIGTPPSSTSNGVSIYDSINNRIIYARADGIWALNLGSKCSSNYLWSNNEANTSTTVSPIETTKYFITVSNGISSCIDSVIVNVNNLNPNLFTQDTIRACGTLYSLDAGAGYSIYSWSNGENSQAINVTASGWYNCTVNNGACIGNDSVFVSLVNANILNNDTTICNGSALSLNTNLVNSTNPQSVLYDFNNCNLNDFTAQLTEGNLVGSASSTNQGLSGCGVNLIRPATLTTIRQDFGYGTYEVDAKAGDGVANQYFVVMNVITLDCRPSGTDDVGYGFYFNGVKVASANGSNPVSYPNWYHIKIRITPDSLLLWLNNSMVYQATYQTPLANPFGPMSISTYSSSFFDNMKFTPLNNSGSYLWSTGETTPSISLSPTQTTTYYCNVSNGISSCTDSITVYVNQPTTSTTDISSCNSYEWNGQTFTQSGTYTWNGTNIANCDSTAILNLTINQSSNETLDVTAVDYYQWHGQMFNSSGTYIYDTLNVGGCDSIITLNLTIQPSITECDIHASDSSICAGQTVVLTSGQLSAFEGCSSSSMPNSLQQNLVAWYPFCGNATDESANSYDGTIRGAQLCEDRFGNPQSAFKFIENQDIIVPNTSGQNLYPFSVSLWYSIDTIMGIYDEANIFSKYTPAVWNGYAIITANMGPEEGVSYYPVVKSWYLKSYNDRLIGRYGSAPFEHANVNMNQWYNMVFTVANDSGKIYINGNLVSKDKWDGVSGPSSNGYLWKIGGLYDRWFHGKIDDIAVYNKTLSPLEINQLYHYQAAGVAQSKSYLWSNGQTTQQINVAPSETTTYYCTVSNGYSSCTDSITIYVYQPSSSVTRVSSCDSYNWNGNNYTESGTYSWTGTNVFGCDSVATLNLTITPSTSNTTIALACDTYTWSVNSQVYTQSGSYTSVTGCHTEILNLTVTPSTSNTTTASVCDSYTWSVNSQAYTQSGTYTSVTGCHTEILNLTITASTSNTTTASACGSYTWSINGQAYTQSGSYTSVNGCRTEILNLTITPRVIKTTALTVCGSYLWATNGQTYNISGSYTFVNGCTSNVLSLTINANSVAPTAATASSTTVTSGTPVTLTVSGGALGTGASWKWYSGSCGGTLVGTGASISVTPTATTTYYVRAEGTCNTTSCASVKVTVQAACGPTAVVSNATGNTVCSGRQVTLTVQGTLATGASWKWYKDGCGTGTSLGSGASLNVTPTVNTTYYVRSEGGTCGTTTCKSVAITVSPLPSTPGTITGNASGVCNTSGVGYSIVAVSGATSYAWTVPTGATIVSGQGTTAIVVNYGASIGTNSSCGSTSVCVKAVNACGSSANKCLTISTAAPTASCGTIVGPSTACTNINATYSCTAVSGVTSYTWVVPSGWTIISGQGTISLIVKPGTAQGTIKVTPSNTCGAGTASSKTVKATTCTTPIYTKSAIQTSEESTKDISIWPNPAFQYINLNDGGLLPEKIEMIDLAGRIVFTSTWKTRLDVCKLNSGLYILRAYTNEGVKVKRVELIK